MLSTLSLILCSFVLTSAASSAIFEYSSSNVVNDANMATADSNSVQVQAHHRSSRATPAADWEQKRWPNATVYFQIDEKLSSIRSELLRAMNQIEDISCVRYVPRTNQVDYVLIEENSTSCREPVGRQGGQQRILIKVDECGVYGFYLHAAMQMLGFYHEHQRIDRDDFITVYPENIEAGKETVHGAELEWVWDTVPGFLIFWDLLKHWHGVKLFTKIGYNIWCDFIEWMWAFEKLNSSSHFRNSTYDTNSIMHYGSFLFSKNNQPTILTKDGQPIESWTEKTSLSPLDVLAINEYYNCPTANQANAIGMGANNQLFSALIVVIITTIYG